MVRVRVCCSLALLLAVSALAFAQVDFSPTRQAVFPDRELRVSGLPLRTASESTGVLAASLETIFHDSAICCGKNSALEDGVLSADSLPLNEVGRKLQGRYLLSDSRRITVSSQYFPAVPVGAVTSGTRILAALKEDEPLLMEWNSHLYVVSGAIFNEVVYSNGVHDYAIHKLLLLDVRFSDARREVSFDRLTDDWGKVKGFLAFKVETGS